MPKETWRTANQRSESRKLISRARIIEVQARIVFRNYSYDVAKLHLFNVTLFQLWDVQMQVAAYRIQSQAGNCTNTYPS